MRTLPAVIWSPRVAFSSFAAHDPGALPQRVLVALAALGGAVVSLALCWALRSVAHAGSASSETLRMLVGCCLPAALVTAGVAFALANSTAMVVWVVMRMSNPQARLRQARIMVSCAGVPATLVATMGLCFAAVHVGRDGSPAAVVAALVVLSISCTYWAALTAMGARMWLALPAARALACSVPLGLPALALGVLALLAQVCVVAPGPDPWLVRGGFERGW